MATVITKVNYGAIARYVSDPNGDVSDDLRRRGRKVVSASKKLVRKRTRALANSIRLTYIPGRNPQISVGSPLDYALFEHDGTRPHIIRPHLRQRLRFKVHGKIVYTTLVRHPGTTGTHYLTIPLRRYAGE